MRENACYLWFLSLFGFPDTVFSLSTTACYDDHSSFLIATYCHECTCNLYDFLEYVVNLKVWIELLLSR